MRTWSVIDRALQAFQFRLVDKSIVLDLSGQQIITNIEFLEIIHVVKLIKWISSSELIATQISVK